MDKRGGGTLTQLKDPFPEYQDSYGQPVQERLR
jgi:hypothetical protein